MSSLQKLIQRGGPIIGGGRKNQDNFPVNIFRKSSLHILTHGDVSKCDRIWKGLARAASRMICIEKNIPDVEALCERIFSKNSFAKHVVGSNADGAGDCVVDRFCYLFLWCSVQTTEKNVKRGDDATLSGKQLESYFCILTFTYFHRFIRGSGASQTFNKNKLAISRTGGKGRRRRRRQLR